MSNENGQVASAASNIAAAVGTKAQDYAPIEALRQESGRVQFENDLLQREIPVQPVTIRFKLTAPKADKPNAPRNWGMFITFTEEKRKTGMSDVWVKVSAEYEALGLIARQGDKVVQGTATLGVHGNKYVLA